MNEDKCIMCDSIIPEGRMVCSNCECENLEPNFETTKVWITLNKITGIAKFVDLASKCKDDVVVRSGNFAVNAKSLMGLYSIDLSKPVLAEFYGNIPCEVAKEIKKFIVE